MVLVRLARLEVEEGAGESGADGGTATTPPPSPQLRALRRYVCTPHAMREAFLEVATDLVVVDMEVVAPAPAATAALLVSSGTEVAAVESTAARAGEDGECYRLVTDVAALALGGPTHVGSAAATAAAADAAAAAADGDGAGAAGPLFESDPLALADVAALYTWDPTEPTGTGTVPLNLDAVRDVAATCDDMVHRLSSEVPHERAPLHVCVSSETHPSPVGIASGCIPGGRRDQCARTVTMALATDARGRCGALPQGQRRRGCLLLPRAVKTTRIAEATWVAHVASCTRQRGGDGVAVRD
jgi:hypothetical protein